MMTEFLKKKSREVQIDTSKKVIKHFIKRIETADSETQTTLFNDQQTIKDLQREIMDLESDGLKLRNQITRLKEDISI